MRVVSCLLLLGAAGLTLVHGHTYHLGDCPNVEPMQDFNMDKFLGEWYVLQKTSTGSSCLLNNYTKNPENSEQYKIEQISEHFLLGLTSYDHKYHYSGDLSVPNQRSPAAMRVQFPLNVVGGASYTVFMTDYTSYAGVFTCQKLAFAHRQSATILSRTPSIDKQYLDKIRSRLSSYGVDPHDLSIIRQTNCTKATPDTDNINIGPEFSVVDAFKKAGEKIGEGVDAAEQGAKKLYNKVRGDHEDPEKGNLSSDRDLNADAEWLP